MSEKCDNCEGKGFKVPGWYYYLLLLFFDFRIYLLAYLVSVVILVVVLGLDSDSKKSRGAGDFPATVVRTGFDGIT